MTWLCPNPACDQRTRTGVPAELPDEVEVCPHCGVDATAFVPMVTIASFPEIYLGHLVRSRLEADGIVATISDEHLASIASVAGDGGVKLQVRRDQVDEALAIIRGPAPGDEAEEGQELESEDGSARETVAGPTCPRCGAAAVSPDPPGVLARLFGVRVECEGCGNGWRTWQRVQRDL